MNIGQYRGQISFGREGLLVSSDADYLRRLWFIHITLWSPTEIGCSKSLLMCVYEPDIQWTSAAERESRKNNVAVDQFGLSEIPQGLNSAGGCTTATWEGCVGCWTMPTSFFRSESSCSIPEVPWLAANGFCTLGFWLTVRFSLIMCALICSKPITIHPFPSSSGPLVSYSITRL